MYFRNIFDHTIYLKKKGIQIFTIFTSYKQKNKRKSYFYKEKKKKRQIWPKKKKNPTCKEHV